MTSFNGTGALPFSGRFADQSTGAEAESREGRGFVGVPNPG
jgi:hypothetical protein